MKRSVVGLSSHRPDFNITSVHERFFVGKVALGQVYFRVLKFFPHQLNSSNAPLYLLMDAVVLGQKAKPGFLPQSSVL